jgi:hypothetical protein
VVALVLVPDHHALARVRQLARPDEGLQHRRAGLLRLQEQRVAVVVAEQQQHEGARADAAHPHDLARGVDEPVLVQQQPPPGSRVSR